MIAVDVAFLILKRESERVPGKNFRDLGGKPLFRWILDTLLETPVPVILVDTDARDRLEALGLPPDPRIRVHDRDPALRGHAVTANTLLAAHLDAFPNAHWLMTHATNPFLSAGTLARATADYAGAIERGDADSSFGVNRHQARFYGPGGGALNHDPARLLPTQQLDPWLEENSTLYLFSTTSFRQSGSRMGLRPRPFETPRVDSLDIDTEDDFALASLVADGLRTRRIDSPGHA